MRFAVVCASLCLLPLVWSCNEAGNPTGTGPNPLPNPGPGPDPSDAYGQARVDAVDAINGYRATLRLPPLAHWSEADSCADEEARKDSEANQAHKNFGSCGEYAQNECLGWPTADSIVNDCLDYMWNEGPGSDYSQHGHYINMSNPNYTEVAIGFYMTPAGKVWCVQNFK